MATIVERQQYIDTEDILSEIEKERLEELVEREGLPEQSWHIEDYPPPHKVARGKRRPLPHEIAGGRGWR